MSASEMMGGEKRVLFSNAGALFVIQIANYILPFLLLPYLTRVLGVDGYGVVAFGLAIVQIACVITDYGFSLSATYKIAKLQENKEELRKIISAVMLCKLGLLVPAGIALALFVLTQEKYFAYQNFFWLLLLPIIGQTFQPVWFFQGIERMTFITLYTVASRLLYLFLTIFWVVSPADYYWAIVANGVGAIIAAAVGIGAMLKLGYWPIWCGWRYVRCTFNESTEFFWSRAAVSTFTAGGSFFLGVFSTPAQVAYYSAAEQLYRGAQALFSPVSQALYPHMARHRDFSLFFKILKAIIVLGVLGLFVGAFFGDWIIQLFFGTGFSPAYVVLLVFMAAFNFTMPSALLGYPFLGALGNSKAANMSVIYSGLVQVVLLAVCYIYKFYQAEHIAMTVLLVQIFVLVYRAYCSTGTYKVIVS